MEVKSKDVLSKLKEYLENGGDPNLRDARGRTLLHYAAKEGNLEAVRLLLKHKADPNARDRRGRTPLHYAVLADDEVVVELIKAGAEVNAKDKDGRTPLHWAAVVKKNEGALLYHGADPDAQDVYGNTPLHYAVFRDNDYGVRVLLEYLADPKVRNKKCMSPIDLAKERRFYELAELMEEALKRRQQASLITCSPGKRTQLHEAAARCNPDEVEKLLHPWVSRDACDEEGRTPLHYAVMCSDVNKGAEIIKMLLRPWPRASPNVRDVHGRTPLHYAVLSRNDVAVKILLEHYADPTVADNEGKMPLDYARERGFKFVEHLLERAMHIWRLAAGRRPVDPDAVCYKARCSNIFRSARFGHLLCVKRLLDAGVDPNVKDRDRTPLHYAAEEGHVEVVKLLLDRGANPNVQDSLGYTPLHLAAERGHVEVVKLLLEHGANVHLKTSAGHTPLHLAVRHCPVVHLLLDAGADPNDKDSYGRTPLHYAAFEGVKCSVEALLQHGADYNTKDVNGDTPLHEAFKGNEKVALILAGVADVNVKNEKGQTPLHLAAERGYVRAIELLLSRGADVNARDAEGNTPLHYAAEMCKVDAARLLVKRGADPAAKNAKEETPLDVAKRQYEKYRKYCNSSYSCWTWREELYDCAETLRVLERVKPQS